MNMKGPGGDARISVAFSVSVLRFPFFFFLFSFFLFFVLFSLTSPEQMLIFAILLFATSAVGQTVISAFSVSPTTTSSSVTASFTVSEGGSSFLDRVSLVRALRTNCPGCAHEIVSTQSAPSNSRGPWSSTLSNSPPSTGSTYSYGLWAWNTNGVRVTESNFGFSTVLVTSTAPSGTSGGQTYPDAPQVAIPFSASGLPLNDNVISNQEHWWKFDVPAGQVLQASLQSSTRYFSSVRIRFNS